MTLRFDPIPYQNREPSGADYAKMWSDSLNQLGQTVANNRAAQAQADHQALLDRIQQLQLEDQYGSVGVRKILRPNAPPRKILAQSRMVNGGQPMTTPEDAPLESFDLQNPNQFAQARQLYGRSGVDPYLDAETRTNAFEDRTLNRTKTLAEIQKLQADALKTRFDAANGGKKTFIGNGMDGRPLFADASGNVTVGDVPGGGPIYPKNATDAQSNAAGYADRATSSHQIINDLFSNGLNQNSAGFGLQEMKMTPNFLKSGNVQSFDQAKRNFLNAILRRESGAVISPSEFSEGEKQYFPVYGDTPQVIKQKAANREMQIRSLQRAAGPMMQQGMSAPPQRLSKQQRNRTTGEVITVYSDDGGQTWHP